MKLVRFSVGIGVSVWLVFAGAQPVPQIRIESLKALLFNAKTGAFSDDVLASGAPQLGNVPSGNLASTSTFVIVKVNTGRDRAVPDRARIRLIATDLGRIPAAPGKKKVSRRVLLDQNAPLGPVGADGTSHVGFWLAETGCNVVEISARVIGAAASVAALTTTIPFACYE